MQTKPTNWDDFFAQEHTVDFKIVIDGVTYYTDDIVSLNTTGNLYEYFGVGNCCSRTLEVEYYPSASPARQATVKVYVRLEHGGQYTDYIQKGTYFISKRQNDYTRNTLSLTCYDAMLKAETVFSEVFPSTASFPMNPTSCVSAIASYMGITLDSRTSINNSFLVSYPVDDDGDMTLRDMLGRVAVANAGNWIITDTNKLLLVGLNSIPPATNYLIDRAGNSITFGGDHILV